MRTTKIPQVDGWMVTIIGSRKLGALVGAFFRPIGRSPACIVDGEWSAQHEHRLLAPHTDGEVPDFDCAVEAGAKKMLSVGVPVDGGARLLMGGDLLFGSPVVAVVPAHDGAVVGAKGEFDSIGGGPLDVVYGSIDAGVLVSAAAGHDVLSRVA